MDITNMLAELRSQKAQLDQAIIALENLARGTGKRRGRPPKWMTETRDGGAAPLGPGTKGPKKKRTLSPEARKKMSEAQKKRWAAAREGSS
jgi:hypothetical protein